MTKKILLVIGYPKSGNSWLARSLGDYLNSPVDALLDSGPALSAEGEKRTGDWIVCPRHDRIPDKWDKCVFIYRDPRDVAVSANHYWCMNSLTKTIHAMGKGKWPIPHGGGLVNFNKCISRELDVDAITTYEDLSSNYYWEMFRILEALEIGVDRPDRLRGVQGRQSFERRKQIVAERGDSLPYGKDVQARLMRKGIVGDWVNHFNREQARIADEYFGELMLDLGYIDSRDWWKEVKK